MSEELFQQLDTSTYAHNYEQNLMYFTTSEIKYDFLKVKKDCSAGLNPFGLKVLILPIGFQPWNKSSQLFS